VALDRRLARRILTLYGKALLAVLPFRQVPHGTAKKSEARRNERMNKALDTEMKP
jgi:hypothetical protein